jgi:hypothetical protein
VIAIMTKNSIPNETNETIATIDVLTKTTIAGKEVTTTGAKNGGTVIVAKTRPADATSVAATVTATATGALTETAKDCQCP